MDCREVLSTRKNPFYQAWCNAVTMLRNRRYRTEEDDLSEGDLMHLLQKHGDHQLLFSRPSVVTDGEERLLMYCTLESKVGIKTVRKLHQALLGSEISRAIIIYETSITPFARQAMKTLQSQEGLHIETFRLLELAIDLIQHKFVPKHTLLTPEQKAEVLKTYETNEDLYPKLLHTDPCARYYGMMPGDMVKVERYYENYGEYVIYRMVT